jgi:hypothetical protein
LGIGALKEETAEGEDDSPEAILAGWSPFGTGNLTSFLGGSLFGAENSTDSQIQDPSFTSFSSFSAFSTFSKQQSQPQHQVRKPRQSQESTSQRQSQHRHPQDVSIHFVDEEQHQQLPRFHPPHIMPVPPNHYPTPPYLHPHPSRPLSAQAAPWESYVLPQQSSSEVYFGDSQNPNCQAGPQIAPTVAIHQQQWNWGAS